MDTNLSSLAIDIHVLGLERDLNERQDICSHDSVVWECVLVYQESRGLKVA